MGYIIQSVVLRRDKFTPTEAREWAQAHGYKTTKIDITPHFTRFRQQDPDRLRGGRFRTIGLGDVGNLVIAYF